MTNNTSWWQGLVNAAVPLVWGASGAALTLWLLPSLLLKPVVAPELKLATVDIAKIMQEYHERVLRDPNSEAAVAHALEDSARAAAQIDPLLNYLVTEAHPGYTLVQPQALAYQGAVPDFTDEFRVLVQKRNGKFNQGLEGYGNTRTREQSP